MSLAAMPFRVLVVDDSDVNLKMYSRVAQGVTGAGIEPIKAVNGQQAVDLVKAAIEKGEMYDVALMDIVMPEKDGLVATTEIRELPQASHLRIFCTTSNEKNCPEKDRRLFRKFIDKNIKRVELEAILNEVKKERLEEGAMLADSERGLLDLNTKNLQNLSTMDFRGTLHAIAQQANRLEQKAKQAVAANASLVDQPSPIPFPTPFAATGLSDVERLRDVANKAGELESVAVSAVAATTQSSIARQAERLAPVAEATTPAAKATSAPVSFPATPASSATSPAGIGHTTSKTPKQSARNLLTSICASAPATVRRITPPLSTTPPTPYQQHQRAYSWDVTAKRDPMLFPAVTSFSIPVLAH